MCGIAGIVALKDHLQQNSSDTLRSMVSEMTHRGPDDAGYFDDAFCTLGMRRLSIIDIKGGNQPIKNEDDTVFVFQNGEIYNFQSLKEELEEKGHHFKTQSDTEVLVHLYEEYDEQMFERLNGMFAVCIYDLEKGKIVVGRDRFGEKPLFYCQNGKTFTFASEIKALLANSEVPRTLDKEALTYYLRTSLIPEPITLFSDVRVLPAGSYLSIYRGELRIKPYFEIDFKEHSKTGDLNEAVNKIRPVLEDAVSRQTISDVPIGCFLSGGIDSSCMSALLQKQNKNPIKTFNVRFEESDYDESPIARAVAEHCGTDHHEIVVKNEGFSQEIFWKIIDHVGQPFRDSSAIPMHRISQEIAKHVKVAISGDGGDELFAGYDLFYWYTRIITIKKVPFPIRKIGSFIISLAQIVLKSSSKIRKLNRVLETSYLDEDEIPIALNEMFNQNEVNNLLESGALKQQAKADYKRLKQYPSGHKKWSPLRKIMYYRSKHTLPANMLVKVDRMSMANSLEVRAPFLDHNLYKAASELSDEVLMSNGTGKLVLREMMKNELPKAVFDHPKQGFNIPLYRFQNKEFQELATHLLFKENPIPQLFGEEQLREIYENGINQKEDNSKSTVYRSSHQLWMMVQLFGWAKRFNVSLN